MTQNKSGIAPEIIIRLSVNSRALPNVPWVNSMLHVGLGAKEKETPTLIGQMHPHRKIARTHHILTNAYVIRNPRHSNIRDARGLNKLIIRMFELFEKKQI